MTNNTINVPRELLERAVQIPSKASVEENHAAIVDRWRAKADAILSAQSPAGVDGCKCSMSISMLGDGCRHCQPQEYIDRLGEMLDEERAELSDAQAIIDGLRGEVERLQRAEKNDAIAYKAAIERNDAREERDHQAQLIGELEGLLRESGKTIHKLQAEQPTPARIARYLDAMRGQIDSALSAGKDGE